MTDIKAKELMMTNLITVTEEMSVKDVARLFSEEMITGAPVLGEDGKLVGVVSVTDIARAQGDEAEEREEEGPAFFAVVEEKGRVQQTLAQVSKDIQEELLVRDVMNPMIFSVSEEAPLQKLAEVMSSRYLHRVLVTRDDRVVGIVTTMDILSAIADRGV